MRVTRPVAARAVYLEIRRMTEETLREQHWLARWAEEPYAYLTTIGRRTGRPHRIEIWFAAQEGRVYLLSGGRERSDWVRNIQANTQVTIELGGETHAGTARVLQAGTNEDQRARELLVAKYATPDNTLDDWKRRSLPVAIELSDAVSQDSPAGKDAQDDISRRHAGIPSKAESETRCT
jgi:deazaflavin-dependent oxidoreductase (nitroreductase family)